MTCPYPITPAAYTAQLRATLDRLRDPEEVRNIASGHAEYVEPLCSPMTRDHRAMIETRAIELEQQQARRTKR